MKLSRRDFLKSTAALAAVAGTLGMGAIALAQDEKGGEATVTIQSPQELAAKFAAAQTAIGGKTMDYCAYDPATDVKSLPQKLPLVVFLHGEDGVGANGTQLTANRGATFFMEDNQLAKNPAYVLAPQCPGDSWTDEGVAELVKQMIDEFCAANAVDTDRIYIEGMSMGGSGTWHMLLTYPELFAGALPMCGEVPASYYEAGAEAFKPLANMPIWAFHCADDDVVPQSSTEQAIAAIKEAGSGCAKYEVFSAGSVVPAHHVWERVFSIGTPYNWLFIQSRARTDGGKQPPQMLFSSRKLAQRLTEVCDYELGKLYVIDHGSEALIVDTAMGGFGAADLHAYLCENVLTNPEAALDILITHKHGDHILGIPTLVASGKVRKVYIHPADEAGLVSSMEGFGVTAEAMNLAHLVEGDVVSIGDETIDVVEVPGHTDGSIVMFYHDYIFTGDAVGSGDLWLFGTSFETYQPAIDHLMAQIAVRGGDYELLTGHLENLNRFSVQYVKDMVSLVRGMLLGQIEPGVYTRREGKYATYGEANIYYTGDVHNA